MATENTGFLDTEINVADIGSEAVPTAFLGPEALEPKYTVARVKEPSSPTISVGGGSDPYGGDESLSSIIGLTTDPDKIKKRREEEEKIRATIAEGGGAEPLFDYLPTVDITEKGLESIVPEFELEPLNMDLSAYSSSPSTDISRRKDFTIQSLIDRYNNLSNPNIFDFDTYGYARDFAKSELQAQALGKVKKDIGEGIVDPIAEGFKEEIKKEFSTQTKWLSDHKKNISSKLDKATDNTVLESFFTQPTDYAQFSQSYQTANVANPYTSSYQTAGTPMAQGAPAQTPTTNYAGTAMKVAGTAVAAYNAYESFKAGDNTGAAINTAAAYAAATGNAPLALAMTAASFIHGFSKGKPKPGMGGSEIRYNKDTGQLEHGTTWSYNGFNPSQAKQQTDVAVKYVNDYSKEFGVKLDPKKFPSGQNNWQYLSRIDVSPYRNGSQSGTEMIERWLSSGAFVGNPSYYDPESGERKYFTSQEEYEAAVKRFSNKQFS